MCGIAGILPTTNRGLYHGQSLQSMLQTLQHRGPDATYHYISPQVAIGMTRLSIVGGESGAQPIWNESETCAVVCNGEIYNHKSLRIELEERGHKFRTESDVETIVHLYEEYGEQCLIHLEGIFALCIYDTVRERMMIARDRVGVKPVYYLHTSEAFRFASEMKALLPFTEPLFCMSAFQSYHELRFAPAPYTLIEGIEKLPPAHYLVIQGHQLRIQGYWRPATVAVSSTETQPMRRQQVRKLVEEAVVSQQADSVPSGVLLSGGLDSTLLVALQTRLFGKAPETITVGFKQPHQFQQYVKTEYDEQSYAAQVASHFGCLHHTAEFGPDETWEALPKIVSDLDEPIADPTTLPLWFASRLSREAGHRVLFSGEGMDELFAGYDLYRQTYWLRALGSLPATIRRGLLSFVEEFRLPGSHLLKHSLEPVTDWYRSIGELFTEAEMDRSLQLLVRHATTRAERHWTDSAITRFLHLSDYANRYRDPLQQMLLFDCIHWLPENTLTKSDKISMAHSIELRVPFVNERLFEYALGLPHKDKLHKGIHKYIVKEAFRDLIPRQVINRPKAGFPVPITAWTFGEWNEPIRDLLLSQTALTRELYRSDFVEELLQSHPSEQRRAARLLWSLVTMELWMRSVLAKTQDNTRSTFLSGSQTDEPGAVASHG